MPDIATLRAVITADTVKFESSMKRANEGLNAFARRLAFSGSAVQNFGSQLSNFGGLLTRSVTIPIAAAAAGLGVFGKKVIDAAIAMDSLDKGLTAITGSASGAADEIANLRKMAVTVPGLDFASAARGTLTLRAMRISAKDTAGVLETLAKANALAAGTTENYASALVQLNQIISSGKVQGDEVRIIREQIATFGLFLKDTFNATTEEISEAINEGKISMQDFVTAFIAWGNTLKPPANSLQNLIVRMKNEINLALADMGKDFIPDLLKLIPELMQAFRDALPAIKDLFRTIADVGVPVLREFIKALTDLLKWFADLAPATQQFIIKGVAIGAIAGPIISVAGAFTQLFGWILKATGTSAAIGSWAAGIASKLPALIPIIMGVADAWLFLRTAQLRAMERGMDAQFSAGIMSEKALAYIQLELQAAAGNLERLKGLAKDWSTNMPGKEGEVALAGLRAELQKIGYVMDGMGNVFKGAALDGQDFAKEFAAIQARMQSAIGGGGKGGGKLASSLTGALTEARDVLQEIADIIAADSDARAFANFGLDTGLLAPLEAAQTKLRSIDSAIQALFQQGLEVGIEQLAKNMAIINRLLGDRKHALIQVAAAEKVLEDAAKARALADFYAAREQQDLLDGVLNFAQKIVGAISGITHGWHEAQIEVGRFREELQQSVQILSDAAGENVNQTLQEISEAMRKMRIEAEDWAYAFTDAFLYGLRRIREEGFAGLLRSFEEMLFDMAMAFLRSQLVNLMTSFFSNLLGAFIGGGGGGINIGNGVSLPGGQTQTGGGDFGGGNMAHVVNNFYITTPDANSFRQSSAQQQIAALQLATANAMRTR